ncbi:MAG: type I polyketide synthase [Marinicaulis sp.]|nr:type I polyketide synthase [Marinicaulis sp.]
MTDYADTEENGSGVAIVGMAGRFPGAINVSEFWENIKGGVDSITRFSPDELEIDILSHEDDAPGEYVCARGLLDDIEMFDARFFGYLPREAEVMDPQHRIFLEICSDALENAACDPERYPGAIGVFGGCYMDTYILWNLCADETFRKRLVESIQVGSLQTELGNDKDYLATRAAYKLGLRGPAMTLQTACSTSLVAVATACQSIESYQCDMALAGGVTLILPQKKGYFYKEGGMLSPDGRCRPFDANAAGTVFSHGAAVVVLKRLENALADGDTIYSVIRGYATNNDGGDKVSYTAPSVEGQAEVISLALGMGGIDASTIGYVEAHGTATPLGDPIEVSGLTTAYRSMTGAKQYCALGSVKANLGHLDVASGAIGLIKTSLALKEQTLPPSINFEKPNPKIDFESSPFYVNTELRDWPASAHPRRAGVSSFGVGGTNAHVVAEEPPAQNFDNVIEKAELLLLSARSEKALAAQAGNLAAHLKATPDVNLANVSHTLRVGRRVFEYRKAFAAANAADAISKLEKFADASAETKAIVSGPELVFMFPGQGAQHLGMGRELYEREPVFRNTIDEIAECLLGDAETGLDIRKFLLSPAGLSQDTDTDLSARLTETHIAQPAIFAVEVALAKLLISWGLHPSCVIGHSIGEFAAAVIAGVYSLADAARLVSARGRFMQAQPPGKMLAVLAQASEFERLELEDVEIAAVNSPDIFVVSGTETAIATAQGILKSKSVGSKLLHTSHAFHSKMMAPARQLLETKASEVSSKPASIDVVSTLTGNKIDAAEFSRPSYWGEQLMSPVLFADAVASAARNNRIFLEVGPGQSLSLMAPQSFDEARNCDAVPTMGGAGDEADELEILYDAIGSVWSRGASVDWSAFDQRRLQRIPLPTYPFERKRFWIDPADAGQKSVARAASIDGDVKRSRNGSADSTAVEQLVEQQLSVISTQLNMLKGKR